MILKSGGYNRKQYRPAEFRRLVAALAKQLPGLMQAQGATHVVVSGKSGIAVGFALTMLIDIPLVVVRKDGESSHGLLVEGLDGTELRAYIILDDFVSSGSTVSRIRRTIATIAERYIYGAPLYCGVIEYDRPEGNGEFQCTRNYHVGYSHAK